MFVRFLTKLDLDFIIIDFDEERKENTYRLSCPTIENVSWKGEYITFNVNGQKITEKHCRRVPKEEARKIWEHYKDLLEIQL